MPAFDERSLGHDGEAGQPSFGRGWGVLGDMTRNKDFKAGNGSWPFLLFFLASSEGRGTTLIKPFLLGFFAS